MPIGPVGLTTLVMVQIGDKTLGSSSCRFGVIVGSSQTSESLAVIDIEPKLIVRFVLT